MKIGKVIGNLVATRKEGNVNGHKILVVNYLDENMKEAGRTAACFDSLNSGMGDIVLLCSSSSARMTNATRNMCTDNTIVAIIDKVSVGAKDLYNKGKEGSIKIGNTGRKSN